ncbi:hypothetical protein CPB97_006113 [Podila verticillata]|nr:hypothetical protein CPB97_006113 [Podila verticillata]
MLGNKHFRRSHQLASCITVANNQYPSSLSAINNYNPIPILPSKSFCSPIIFSINIHSMNILQRSSLSTARSCRRFATSASASKTASTEPPTKRRERESLDPALNTDKFLVGNPHPVSNLRPVRYPVPSNESAEDHALREQRERVDAFNQNFWVNNNNMFNKAKAEYEDKIRAQNGGEAVTTEELSIFYKDFLDKAYERQMNYNRQWWIENVGLLWPSAKSVVRKWTSK